MRIIKLAWVGTRTDNAEPTVAFFRDVLDLRLELDRPGFWMLKLPDGSRIEVFGPDSPINRHFTTGPVAGFLVDDIQAATAGLRSAGVEILFEMALTDVVAAEGVDRAALLRLAGAVEADSEHPIGAAIAAARQQGDLPAAHGFQAVAGQGVHAEVPTGEGGPVTVWVGRRKLTADAGLLVPTALEAAAERLEGQGRTAVLVGWQGEARGVLAVADTLKDGAADLVGRLHGMGLEVAMLTGDNQATAQAIAAAVGVDRVLAEVLPADKVGEIARLQAEGRVVAMVGDGVNDAPALVQADLGIAIGTGTDVAIQASDLTLLRGDLEGVATAIALSRRTYRTIAQNLFWAFGYHTAAIPRWPRPGCSAR
jgi:cation-transporting ATPase V